MSSPTATVAARTAVTPSPSADKPALPSASAENLGAKEAHVEKSAPSASAEPSSGAKAWTALENVALIQPMHDKNMSENAPATHQQWIDLAAGKKEGPIRNAEAMRQHVTDLLYRVRTMSSSVSKANEGAVSCPSFELYCSKQVEGAAAASGDAVDVSPNFDTLFRIYTDKIYAHYCTVMQTAEKNACGSSKWYSAEVIFQVRRFIFKIDNKTELTKKENEKRTNKFTQETDAKRVQY